MYLCVRGIYFATFYGFSTGFWKCSDSVVFIVFHCFANIAWITAARIDALGVQNDRDKTRKYVMIIDEHEDLSKHCHNNIKCRFYFKQF
jgi:hypothetical protein